MYYRIARNDDTEMLTAYCRKYDLAIPSGLVFVAINDQGEICGTIGLKMEAYIEPIIADNPVIGNNLFRMLEGVILEKGFTKVRAMADESKFNRLIGNYDRTGFEVIERNKFIVEKNYG